MRVITEFIETIRPVTSTYPVQPVKSFDMVVANEAIDKLTTEGGESFFNYVDSRGLSKDPSLIVLSSSHYYYYDFEEINNAKTVVYLKELNLSLIHISEPTRQAEISYAVFCLKKKK